MPISTFQIINLSKLEVAIAMKAHGQQQYKTIYVEATVMNMYTKFQLHAPCGF